MAAEKTRPALLTEAERQGAVWKKIKDYLEKRLTAARERNDKDKDERSTALLRGRIAELKHLAALDQPAPQTEADDIPE